PGTASARPQAAAEFWMRAPASRELQGDPLQVVTGGETPVAGMRVRWWPVDHSIPGAGAFGVQTPAGWVVYTGDLRLHGSRGHLTRAFA
ncbi:MAG: exonuclease, partial [Bacillota bacterium]|nr:exonuclease [Bacillota bacterium]